jgi:hypothetical protein
MECLRKGMSKDQAPMFVNMQRSAKVQIGAHVIKILNTCLRCPVPDVHVERQYEIYYHARTNEAQLSIEKDRKRAIETQRLKDEKMCPLTITRMPWELIAGDETRAAYNTRLRLRLLDALFYCTKMEKAVARERKHKFTREYFSIPALYTGDPADFTRRRDRVLDVMSNFQLHACSLPLWYYDEAFCVTRLPRLHEWCVMSHEEICIDFWVMYINMKQPHFAFVMNEGTGGCLRVMMGDTKCAETVTAWLEPAMYSLMVINRLDLNKPNVIYGMDMRKYAEQCSATPIVVVSPDMQRYLLNRDSYIPPSKNTFCFELCLTSIAALIEREVMEYKNS